VLFLSPDCDGFAVQFIGRYYKCSAVLHVVLGQFPSAFFF
jgi:hypothetical protein